jgi:type VI secretion system secreted protein VgrG
MELKSSLAPDQFVINGLSGSEAISGLFCFRMELLASGIADVDVMELRGQALHVTMQAADSPRYFHGIVRRMTRGRADLAKGGRGYRHYHAEVVPWLWLLTQRAGCRIFQDLTIPEIIKKIFDEYKGAFSDFVDYEDSTVAANHIPLDYCAQYRETDFNFVSRLMEQDGILYYFDHDDSGHKLVFTDSTTALTSIEGNALIRDESEEGYGEREGVITSWNNEWNIHPDRYTMRDHHFELPDQTLEVNLGSNGFLEVYDYPGEYASRFNKPAERLDKVNDEGDKLVRVRLEEEELPAAVYEGSSSCRHLAAGHNFKRNDPFDTTGPPDEYTLISVNFSVAQSPDYFSNSKSSDAPYHNSFVCVLGRESGIRPRRLTPKPVVAGPQTAIVTVKDGEESWLDKYGRVRVQFHWDREGQKDENSTCWVRVAQPWAGTSWGAHFWPRIGQEVVVEFLEGDPDRPLITGSVYNAANMPPYKLPDNYTRSGIITRSSKNGASSNFNELRFEDKKGSEQIFINAERDMDHRVEHVSREFVGATQHLIVQGTQYQAIGGDKNESVKGDHLVKIEGNHSRQLTGDHMETIQGNLSLNVTGDQKEQVGGSVSLQVGNAHQEKVQQKYALDVGQEIHIKSGMKLIIEAGAQLSLKGPGGFVDIGPSGVTIQGTMVLINSGGSAGSGSGSSPDKPDDPKDPKWPQTADDGSKGGALS